MRVDANRLVEEAQRSLRRLLVGRWMDRRDLGALLLDRGGKLSWRAAARRRTDRNCPRAKGGIGGDGVEIRRDPLLERCGHVAPAVEADRALESELAIADLRCGRNIRRLRRTVAIGDEQQ